MPAKLRDSQLELDVVADLGVYVLRVVAKLAPGADGDLVGLGMVPVGSELEVGLRVDDGSRESGERESEDSGGEDGGDVEVHD